MQNGRQKFYTRKERSSNRVAFNEKVRNGYHYHLNGPPRFQYTVPLLYLYNTTRIWQFGVIIYKYLSVTHAICIRFNKKTFYATLLRAHGVYDTIRIRIWSYENLPSPLRYISYEQYLFTQKKTPRPCIITPSKNPFIFAHLYQRKSPSLSIENDTG